MLSSSTNRIERLFCICFTWLIQIHEPNKTLIDWRIFFSHSVRHSRKLTRFFLSLSTLRCQPLHNLQRNKCATFTPLFFQCTAFFPIRYHLIQNSSHSKQRMNKQRKHVGQYILGWLIDGISLFNDECDGSECDFNASCNFSRSLQVADKYYW